MELRVALIGYGSVGREVVERVRAGEAGPARIVAIVQRSPERFAAESERLGIPFVPDVAAALAHRPTLAVEAAGHDGFRAHVPAFLEAGADVIAISVGAFANPDVVEAVMAAAVRGDSRLRVPAGAIAGLDAISSAAVGPITRVVHTVRKPPINILSEEEAAEVMRSGQPRELYAGPARQAVVMFPANVNVVAAVSLAGIGLDRTESRVVADPAVSYNIHEVEVEGYFGHLSLRIENVPGPNPKTGRIVPLSIIRAVRGYGERVVVGA